MHHITTENLPSMKDTFGVDSCRVYGRYAEGIGGSSVGERNVLLTDSLSLCSGILALSPDANPAVTSFVSMPASATLLDSNGDDSETIGMLVLPALKTAFYNKHNAVNYIPVLKTELMFVVAVPINQLVQL